MSEVSDSRSVPPAFSPVCPIPLQRYPHVLLAHGGGGKLMRQLIESVFLAAFGAPPENERHDGALLEFPPRQKGGGEAQDGERKGAEAGAAPVRLAFTTDSYVVRPLFFPGGDIGSLAVNGTVNDLAMCGARPLYLSAGFILEEGLPMETLWRVAQSMRRAADAAGVRIVTGDTKVVDRGKGDGIFINTAGIGLIEHDHLIAPRSVRPGDAVLLSGDVGRHGIAIMAAREALDLECALESDCAPLASGVARLFDAGIEVHCLRDCTRGGLSASLIEIAEAATLEVHIEDTAIPVEEQVRGACELLGFDPLYVANEGCFVAFVPGDQADRALEALRGDSVCAGACRIGTVAAMGGPSGSFPGDAAAAQAANAAKAFAGRVILKSRVGANRILDLLSGEQLPRIC